MDKHPGRGIACDDFAVKRAIDGHFAAYFAARNDLVHLGIGFAEDPHRVARRLIGAFRRLLIRVGLVEVLL